MLLIGNKSIFSDIFILPAMIINESDLTLTFLLFFVNMSLFFLTKIIYSLLATLTLKSTVWNSITTALKFISLIAMLIFSRGGIPRYRYDFLTKIG